MNHKQRIDSSSSSSSSGSSSSGSSNSSLYTIKGLTNRLYRYIESSDFLSTCLHALVNFFKRLSAGLAVYCRKGSITGTRYLVQPNYHYTERIFWAICLFCSICLGLVVIWQYLNTYTDNIFRIVVEDRDINEQMQFPPIGICENGDFTHKNAELVKLFNKMTSNNTLISEKYDKPLFIALHYMFYNTYHPPRRLAELFRRQLRSFYRNIFRQINFEEVAEKVRSSCKELFIECTWLDKSFDCCTYFREIKTIEGKCFVMNSLQTESGPHMNLTVIKSLEKPSIFISFRRNANVLLLHTTDVPESLSNDFSFRVSDLYTFNIEFTHRPMITDAALFSYNLNVSNCYEGREQYMDWKKLVPFTYKHNSFSSCLTDCIRYLQYNACGCISYIFNKGVGGKFFGYCDVEGYLCLEDKGLFQFYTIHELKDTICRECLLDCNAGVNTIIAADRKFVVNGTRSARFTLLSFPHEQLHRQVIRGDIDVLVSLGGILSLFIGMSAIGMLEFLFIVIRAMIRTRI